MQLLADKITEIEEKVREKFLKSNKIDRYNHVLGVVKMASYLAEKYNVDQSKATIAALIHDYYKYEDIETLKTLINKDDLEECASCDALYHAYASANALKDVFGIDDIEIYNAIRYHVFGRYPMTRLEEIIVISDYTEENRKYEDCIIARKLVINKTIEEAIAYSAEKTIEHLLKEGIPPQKMNYVVLQKYKEKVNNA